MQLIAKHPYIKVERVVDGLEQKDIKHSRTIYLYDEKVVTAYREFPIELVTDFSFKAIGGSGGILYLHTLRGVFAYNVTSTPNALIEAYRVYVKKSTF